MRVRCLVQFTPLFVFFFIFLLLSLCSCRAMYIHRNKKKGFQELKVWEAISVSSFQWVYGGDDKKNIKQDGIFSQWYFEILATRPLYIIDKGNSDGIFCSDTFVWFSTVARTTMTVNIMVPSVYTGSVFRSVVTGAF